MDFDIPLIRATLLRRYKRFLADVTLEDGRTVTAHCANPGAMTGVSDPGAVVWLEPNDNPARKLKYSWKLVELPGGHLAGIDTGVPNKLVGEALAAQRIAEVAAYPDIRAEVKYGDHSRIDFRVAGGPGSECYIEVKNVHLRRNGDLAEFPDSVTARGAKHLRDLAEAVGQGYRSVMLYVIQRDDCSRMTLAADIDPAYARAAAEAAEAGVEFLCYGTRLSREGIWLDRPLPIRLPG